MDDFPGILARDFGFKPQGKAAPMAARPSSGPTTTNNNFNLGSDHPYLSSSTSASSKPIFDDHDQLFSDVFGGAPKYSSEPSSNSTPPFDYDSIFKDQDKQQHHNHNAAPKSGSPSAGPVFDKPVYDEDIFDGLPGIKSSSTSTGDKFTNVFASMNKPKSSGGSSPFDDLLGNLGKKDADSKSDRASEAPEKELSSSDFDDLLGGFGTKRSTSDSGRFQKSSSASTNTASNVMDDPFAGLDSTPTVSSSGVFTDPLEEFSKLSGSGNTRVESASVGSGVFDDIDPLQGLGKSTRPTSSDGNKRRNDQSPSKTGPAQSSVRQETFDKTHTVSNDSHSQKRMPVDNFQESHDAIFYMPNVSTDFHRSVGRSTSPSYMNATSPETNSRTNSTPRAEELFESPDDIWLTVSEVPLFTQPTSAPPPSRPPPPRPTRISRSDTGSFFSASGRKKINDSFPNSTRHTDSPKSTPTAVRSPFDELDDFAMGRSHNSVNEPAEVPAGDDFDSNSVAAASAAAMKDAMDKAEAKFRHAKEMRERENLKAARSKDSLQQDRDEYARDRELRERQERLACERHQREREGEEREQRRLEREREEKEREQRRLQRERMEREREKEIARLAVERATREARERATADARARAGRAAVEKAASEARERAERAAVQRAQNEARERAAADARERAERAAAEAREREKARERAAVERAAQEARERAAAEARERAAAAAARANQQKSDDLDSFFSMGRASSAPRPRANNVDPAAEAQNRGAPDTTRRSSVGTSSNMKKASSTTNIVDDLSSIFGAATASSGEFQEVEGETEERRRARMERHQRTQERAAKALAEKNQRDLQAQREQAERHRISETLDVEIKRWAAGKEGNLRALLSTLQYVLWPECGWQPVSLTDLITGASVKKVYRKATLCIHPDKVQQKGATLQQKYVAEKVFDLLKEAWNKFNSEELF